MVFDIIKAGLGGASVGSAFGPWGAGIGAGLGVISSAFDGGGSGSSGGGGGGMDISGVLPQPLGFMEDYLENKFNLGSTFGSGDYKRLEGAMDAGKLDKYQLMSLYDAQGLDAGDKNYFDALTSTIGKERGKELASVIGQSMFRGATPSRKDVKDAYRYALATGSTGSPKEAQQAFASYFAQTPEGMKNRMPSSQELLAGMKYGPLVGTESGVFQFAGSPRTQDMIARLDKTKDYTSKKAQQLFNA